MHNSRIENEIEHGKKIVNEAESFWGWSSYIGQLRAERRANLIVNLGKFTQSDHLLELGCGTGTFTKKIYNKTNAQITPVDISPELLVIARNKLPEIDFMIADAMNLPFSNEKFTGVYGSSVLHHLDIKKALVEIFRVLKKNGKIVFAEPNMINPQIFIQKNVPFIKKLMGESPDEKAIIRWKLFKQMKSIGFKNIKIFPYDFLHPVTPKKLVKQIDYLGRTLERIPIIKEIAGSVMIYAEK